MPKMKTRKSISKRFKMNKKGKIKRSRAFKGHLLGGKSAKRKRKLSRGGLVSKADLSTIRRMLPYG